MAGFMGTPLPEVNEGFAKTVSLCVTEIRLW